MELKELFQKVASLGFCVFSVQYDPTTQIFELNIQTPVTEQKCRATMMALEAAKFDISSMITDALFVDVMQKEKPSKTFGTNYELACPSCGQIDYSGNEFCRHCGEKRKSRS